MKLSRFSTYLIALATASLLAACGSSTKKDDQSSDEFKQAEESLKDQIKDVVYNIPSPSEIPYLLQATGAEFNQSLLNDRKKVDQYLSRSEKAALNLGVYAADIGYLSSYEKTQEAIDYLNSAKKLADNLNISSFDPEVLKRFESNISNRDSLSNLLDGAIKKTDKYLKDDQRNKLAALLVTGSFVEGLSISTGLIKTYPKNLLKETDRNAVLTPLIQVILNQEKSVDELSNMLSTVDQAEPISTIQTDLTALKASYRALNIQEQIKNNRSDLVLSDKNLVEITKIIDKMRKEIVE
ncbi:MAG: hypothetical protein ACK5R0_03040 [Bacteroidota bacterium]|jgi:hypothetical protein|nr:hypothetical protein [Bacteroidota bacterium]MCA4899860.1 hypothetical protein [Cytophagales bacterium]